MVLTTMTIKIISFFHPTTQTQYLPLFIINVDSSVYHSFTFIFSHPIIILISTLMDSPWCFSFHFWKKKFRKKKTTTKTIINEFFFLFIWILLGILQCNIFSAIKKWANTKFFKIEKVFLEKKSYLFFIIHFVFFSFILEKFANFHFKQQTHKVWKEVEDYHEGEGF